MSPLRNWWDLDGEAHHLGMYLWRFTLSPSLCSCSLCFLAIRWAAISSHHGILSTTGPETDTKVANDQNPLSWVQTKNPSYFRLMLSAILSVTFLWLLINSEAIYSLWREREYMIFVNKSCYAGQADPELAIRLPYPTPRHAQPCHTNFFVS